MDVVREHLRERGSPRLAGNASLSFLALTIYTYISTSYLPSYLKDVKSKLVQCTLNLQGGTWADKMSGFTAKTVHARQASGKAPNKKTTRQATLYDAVAGT